MKYEELCVYKDCEDFQTFDRHFTEAYKKSEVDAAIAELKERDRKTKRALWLAREARAKATWQKILRDAGIFFAIGKCKEWDFYNTKQKKWQRVETKCAAKAKEYK